MVRSRSSIGSFAVAVAALAGCAVRAEPPRRPHGTPPSPQSVTAKQPGGDADDPERAALERLLAEPFKPKSDYWRTLHVPLADGSHWRRVRLWGHETRASFRYGDDHFAVATVWYAPAKDKSDAASCLAQFLDTTMPIARTFDVTLFNTQVVQGSQLVGKKLEPMLIELTEAHLGVLLAEESYAGAIAAYPSWPSTCLVQGFAVMAGHHHDLAVKVRDRWVNEAAPLLAWDKHVKKAPPTSAR